MNTVEDLIKAHTGSPIIYSKPGCPPCFGTKRKFRMLGLDYREVDTTKDAAARDMLIAAGFMESPVIITSAAAWSGYHEDKIQALATSTLRERTAA